MTAAGSAADGEETSSGGGDDEHLDAVWEDSRSGAWSGRGFSFQYAVGAWLTAGVGAGLINAVVVPEGFEDVSLEGLEDGASLHVQAKSRGEASGLFPVHRAVDHVLESWGKHIDRAEPSARLAVVLERGVDGETLPGGLVTSAPTLSESLQDDSRFLSRLRERCAHRGMSDVDVDRLLSSVVVVGVTWDEVTNETAACVDAVTDLPPSSLRMAAYLLVGVVARASAENASRERGDRRCLDRTEIVGEIHGFVAQVDVGSLKAAVCDGVCEPFEYGPREDDETGRFYEGTATQPYHVASGLVVTRLDLIEQIRLGLDERSAVVITGPSGVGKSAVLWTIPHHSPEVLWFRVRRLAVEDVTDIIRLARAYGVSSRSPVGFLVDSAGTGDFMGWARLRREAAAVSGLLLVCTAREEDLTVLGGLAECATVAVRLDEQAAETIYGGLKRRGATTAPHWREAFEQADGLTLEFTHLLTRGQRLGEVIGDQVNARIQQERSRELEVLTLAATADRWSAEISTVDMARACGMSDFDLRAALERLDAEHLVVERRGRIVGLHRLRSAAICEAIHDRPPPTLGQTITRVIPLIAASQLHRFIAAVLTDNPQMRDAVIDAFREEDLSLMRVAGCLQGLRLGDFRDRVRRWSAIADRHDVPPSTRPLLFGLGIAEVEPPSLLPAAFHHAWQELVAAPGSDTRSQLVEALGHDTIAQLVASADDPKKASQILATLSGIGPDTVAALSEAFQEDSPLAVSLREASVEIYADCVAAAYDIAPDLAQQVVEVVGGEVAVMQRVRADQPGITLLEVQHRDGNHVVSAQFMHLPEAAQQDPDAQAHSLGRLLLSCLPRIDSVDINAVLPGNHVLHGSLGIGTSQLSRQYQRPRTGTAWVQARTRVALAELGEADSTRLHAALPMLEEAADLAHQIGTVIVTGQPPRHDFDQRHAALHHTATQMRPPLRHAGIGDIAITEHKPPELTDPLSALILDISGNVIPRLIQGRDEYLTLAAYISNTVLTTHLTGALQEPWRLTGIDSHPAALTTLRSVLEDLYALVKELANNDADAAAIRSSALNGQSGTALRRAASTCRRARNRRHQKRRKEVQSTCRETGLRARVFDSTQETAMSEYSVCVELDSVVDWHEAAAELAAALDPVRQPGETYLLVPLRRHRPVPSLAMRLTQSLHAEPNPEGLNGLPPPRPSELADTVVQACDSLLVLSAVFSLPEGQQDHESTRAAIGAAEEELEAVLERISGMPQDDPVINIVCGVLKQFTERVQAERDGTSTAPSLAEQITTVAALGDVSDELARLIHAQHLALEWGVDVDAAMDHLL
ncbi:MAG: hypothetical protein F4Z00_11020 [Acidimicrobiaceae bacterium]|nr:hypothetical protein [Acidimicrobiaceae bacterium]MXZ66062.1 hypothetical protein [Acidimicrobiaceae bacterium]MYF33047.1 hypothetical protein [Acidimicrobiaceae bacterium]MYG79702.1 hypothetical protein [Acidimicrobiaceae bacterium]MYJ83666.1 hypothetical protein [Acidimicrobiaceae bacterium]